MRLAASQEGSPVVSPQNSMGRHRPKARLSFSQLNAVGSIQAELDQNDLPDLTNEPGPGYYFHPESVGFSSLAEQKFSKCASAPQFSLPKTGWENWRGTIISKDHNKAFAGKDSPGAIYEVPDSLSRNGAKIGTSVRPDVCLGAGFDPYLSPGPSSLNLNEARGQNVMNREDFGKSKRFPAEKRGQIGPGQYARKDFALSAGTGKSIGNSRSSWEKVITPGYETANQCKTSPGVGPPLWRDINAQGSRASSLGRAERFPKSQYEHCSPGPAGYGQNTGNAGKGTSFGNNPKKPRFRPHLAQNVSNRGGWGYF